MKRFHWAVLILTAAVAVAGCGSDNDGTGQIGTFYDDLAFSAATGGSEYAVGFSEGSFDGHSNIGFADIIAAKFDFNKKRIWSRQVGTPQPDIGYAAASDASGNLYAAGTTYGGLDGNSNSGFYDIFTMKFNPDGGKLWTQQIGTEYSDAAYGVTVDPSGYVYVTGYTGGNLDGNPSSGNSDIFLIKYDPSGARIWTRQWGTSYDDVGRAVITDSSGNAYVTGYTFGALDGNPSSGGMDLFVTKYNSAGMKAWTRQLGTSAADEAFGIALGENAYVYVTGTTGGSLDGNVNAGKSDYFLTKYDLNGGKHWTTQQGTAANEQARGIAIDSYGYVYVSGFTYGGLDGNANSGMADVFIAKFNTDKSKVWTRQTGTFVDDFCYDLVVDAADAFFLVGATFGDLDGKTNQGRFDLFILKYDTFGNKL